MKTERKEKRNNMDLNEAVIILKESGYDMFNENYPIIICADMGAGKTTFIEKLNKEKPGSGYDLEVADIPGIWGEPDSEGIMTLVDGWENIALDKIAELDADYVAVTSDKKLVNLLIDNNIPFFLAYKYDVDAVRETIVNRTKTHFHNVVTDFHDYIVDSDIPEDLKQKMLDCDESALYDYHCTEAIPEEIIDTDDFQNDDRYRHWHDMFKIRRVNGESYSIMDQNLNELENRLKFYETITSNICYKIPLDKDQFLSSPEILDEIIQD